MKENAMSYLTSNFTVLISLFSLLICRNLITSWPPSLPQWSVMEEKEQRAWWDSSMSFFTRWPTVASPTLSSGCPTEADSTSWQASWSSPQRLISRFINALLLSAARLDSVAAGCLMSNKGEGRLNMTRFPRSSCSARCAASANSPTPRLPSATSSRISRPRWSWITEQGTLFTWPCCPTRLISKRSTPWLRAKPEPGSSSRRKETTPPKTTPSRGTRLSVCRYSHTQPRCLLVVGFWICFCAH